MVKVFKPIHFSLSFFPIRNPPSFPTSSRSNLTRRGRHEGTKKTKGSKSLTNLAAYVHDYSHVNRSNRIFILSYIYIYIFFSLPRRSHRVREYVVCYVLLFLSLYKNDTIWIHQRRVHKANYIGTTWILNKYLILQQNLKYSS